MENLAFAQANKTNSGDVNCSASGSSIEVMAARSSRYSLLLNNVGSTSVRIGYLDTGTANLTTANSWLLQAGQAYGESVPNVVSNRIVCMSTSGSTNTISFSEAFK